MGADLVGKIEAGIPEDDPRNPGVIADNVGDNVGDVAGMGSDIFESYCGAMIATIAIASTMSAVVLAELGAQSSLMFLPLALASIGLLCSIVGIFIVKKNASKSPEKALRMGTMGASILFIITALLLILMMDMTGYIWMAVLAGAVGGIIIGLITEYYTAGSPIPRLAKAGETGPATGNDFRSCTRYAVSRYSGVYYLCSDCGVESLCRFVRRGYCGRRYCLQRLVLRWQLMLMGR